MRRDIRRRVFCPVISPAWRRRIGSGPLAAAVGRQREPLALVHEFRSGVVLDDLGAFDRCPAMLRVGGVQISGPRSARTGGPPSYAKIRNEYKKPSYSGLRGNAQLGFAAGFRGQLTRSFANRRSGVQSSQPAPLPMKFKDFLPFRLRSFGQFRVARGCKPLPTKSTRYRSLQITPRNTGATRRFRLCSWISARAPKPAGDGLF